MTKEQLQFVERVSKHWLLRNLFSSDVAKFIGCQFALESDFGNSKLALTQHNFCGMKVPKKRVFYGESCIYNSFARYQTFDECVIDYVAWVFYNRPNNREVRELPMFVGFIEKHGYCPEPGYAVKIINLLNSI